MNRYNPGLLVGGYLAVAALAVVVGGLLAWFHLGPTERTGSVEVLASARTPEVLAPAPVRIHSSVGWLQLTAAAGGAVPVAPDNRSLARGSVPARAYDQLELGGARLPLAFSVAAGQVEAILVEVSAGRPNPNGLYAGSQDVSLGLNELAGRQLAVPAFRLVDQAGRAFDNSSIAGHDVVLAAFHTECHTTCPLYTGLFLQLQHRLPPGTLLVEVTTDPAHDTPEVLRAYAAAVDAGWTLATGDPAQVASFWKPFSVELSNGEVHSSTLLLIDRHGFLRQPYQGVPRLDQPLAAQLRAQLNAAGQAQLATGGDGWGAAQVLDALHTIGLQLERSVAPGGMAPQFAASDLAGQPVSLVQFRGRPLLLNFWATWCDPCRRELPLLQRTGAGHPGLAVLLVDEGSDAALARSFTSGLAVNLPSALDGDGRIAAAYKVGPALPTTFFVKADGTIEGVYVGELDQTVLQTHLVALGVG